MNVSMYATIDIVNIFKSIISHLQYVTEYCHISQNTTIELIIYLKFTLRINAATHKSITSYDNCYYIHHGTHVLDDAVLLVSY